MTIPRALDVSSYRIIPQMDNSFIIVLRFADGDRIGEYSYATESVHKASIPKKILGMWRKGCEGYAYQFVCLDPKFRSRS